MSSTRRAEGSGLVEQRPHRLDRTDVEAASRRRGHEHARRVDALGAVQLARDQHLLRVAAGQDARLRVGTGSLDLVLGDQLTRFVDRFPGVDEEAAWTGEQQVLGDRQRGRESGAEPVFGHEREPGRARRACAAACHFLATDEDAPERRPPDARDQLAKFPLPVPRNARDADDLAAEQLQRDAVDERTTRLDKRELPQLEHRRDGRLGGPPR